MIAEIVVKITKRDTTAYGHDHRDELKLTFEQARDLYDDLGLLFADQPDPRAPLPFSSIEEVDKRRASRDAEVEVLVG